MNQIDHKVPSRSSIIPVNLTSNQTDEKKVIITAEKKDTGALPFMDAERVCLTLQRLGLIDDKYRWKNPAIFGPLPASSVVENVKGLGEVRLFSKFINDDETMSYELDLFSYKELIKSWNILIKSSFSPLQNITVHGSGAAALLGLPFFKDALSSACPEATEIIQQLDVSHIQDNDDLDTSINLQGLRPKPHISPFGLHLETWVVEVIIRQHYETPDFTVNYNNGCKVTLKGFENLVEYLANQDHRYPENSLATHVSIDTTIPWLSEWIMEKKYLTDFYYAIDQTSNLSAQKIKELACIFLFTPQIEPVSQWSKKFIQQNISTTEMQKLVPGSISFKWIQKFVENCGFLQFHSLQKENDWHRLTLQDKQGFPFDFLLMRQTNVSPKTRIAYQNLSLDLIPMLEGKDQVPVMTDWQAILDKACRLIDWTALDHANQTDWALYCFLLSKHYRCVDAKTPEILKQVFLSWSKINGGLAEGLVNVFLQRFQSRHKKSDMLFVASLFNALTSLEEQSLPREDTQKIWQLARHHLVLNSPTLALLLNVLTEEGSLDHSMVLSLFQVAAFHVLFASEEYKKQAAIQVCIAHHCGQEVLQVTFENHSLLLPFSPLKAFQALSSKSMMLSTKAWELLHALAPLPYRFSSPIDLPAADLLKTAQQLIQTTNPPAVRQGYSLLMLAHILSISRITLSSLISYLPHLLKVETSVTNRQEILQSIERGLQHCFPNLDTTALLAYLQKSCTFQKEEAIFDSTFFHILLSSAEPELANLAINLWNQQSKAFPLEKQKQEAIQHFSHLHSSHGEGCLKLVKVLESKGLKKELFNESLLSWIWRFIEKKSQHSKWTTSLYQLMELLTPLHEKQLEQWIEQLFNTNRHVAGWDVVHMAHKTKHLVQFLSPAISLYNKSNDSPRQKIEWWNALIKLHIDSDTSLYSHLVADLASRNQVSSKFCAELLQKIQDPEKAYLLVNALLKLKVIPSTASVWLDYIRHLSAVNPTASFEAWTLGKKHNVSVIDSHTDLTVLPAWIETLFSNPDDIFISMAEDLCQQLKSLYPNKVTHTLQKAALESVIRRSLPSGPQTSIKLERKDLENLLISCKSIDANESISERKIYLKWSEELCPENKEDAAWALSLLSDKQFLALYQGAPSELIQIAEIILRKNVKEKNLPLSFLNHIQDVVNKLDIKDLDLQKTFYTILLIYLENITELNHLTKFFEILQNIPKPNEELAKAILKKAAELPSGINAFKNKKIRDKTIDLKKIAYHYILQHFQNSLLFRDSLHFFRLHLELYCLEEGKKNETNFFSDAKERDQAISLFQHEATTNLVEERKKLSMLVLQHDLEHLFLHSQEFSLLVADITSHAIKDFMVIFSNLTTQQKKSLTKPSPIKLSQSEFIPADASSNYFLETFTKAFISSLVPMVGPDKNSSIQQIELQMKKKCQNDLSNLMPKQPFEFSFSQADQENMIQYLFALSKKLPPQLDSMRFFLMFYTWWQINSFAETFGQTTPTIAINLMRKFSLSDQFAKKDMAQIHEHLCNLFVSSHSNSLFKQKNQDASFILLASTAHENPLFIKSSFDISIFQAVCKELVTDETSSSNRRRAYFLLKKHEQSLTRYSYLYCQLMSSVLRPLFSDPNLNLGSLTIKYFLHFKNTFFELLKDPKGNKFLICEIWEETFKLQNDMLTFPHLTKNCKQTGKIVNLWAQLEFLSYGKKHPAIFADSKKRLSFFVGSIAQAQQEWRAQSLALEDNLSGWFAHLTSHIYHLGLYPQFSDKTQDNLIRAELFRLDIDIADEICRFLSVKAKSLPNETQNQILNYAIELLGVEYKNIIKEQSNNLLVALDRLIPIVIETSKEDDISYLNILALGNSLLSYWKEPTELSKQENNRLIKMTTKFLMNLHNKKNWYCDLIIDFTLKHFENINVWPKEMQEMKERTPIISSQTYSKFEETVKRITGNVNTIIKKEL